MHRPWKRNVVEMTRKFSAAPNLEPGTEESDGPFPQQNCRERILVRRLFEADRRHLFEMTRAHALVLVYLHKAAEKDLCILLILKHTVGL